jgi:hypothetical protein
MSPRRLVLVTLNNLREKFWRAMLVLTPAGVSVRGVDVLSLDDFTQPVKFGEAARAGVMSFPMYRIEEDDSNDDLPSLAEFRWKTGIEVLRLLAEPLP